MKTIELFRIVTLLLMVLSVMVFYSCSDDDDIVNDKLPVLTTAEVTDITPTTATSGGNITDDGGAAVTARGVIWSTSADLTVNNYEGITSDGAGAGNFTSKLFDLKPETQYFVRAYATNINGTGYGNAMAFTTPLGTHYGDGVTDIDGNEYITVIIGNQEWMAENLRVTKYNNGEAIPTGLSNTDWANTTSGAYAIYPHGSIDGLESDEEVLGAYGALYNWYAVDDERGICPTGWHVPSEAEGTELVNYVVSHGYLNEQHNQNGAGNALKSCRQVGSPFGGDCNTNIHPRWDSHDLHHGFDAFGFSALPGGYRGSSSSPVVGSFNNVGYDGLWWSATERSVTDAWFRILFSFRGNVIRSYHNKSLGVSVRCLRAD